MAIPLDAAEVLNREFLPLRARLLEMAAALDRIDRAEGSAADDARLARIQQALAVLAGRQANRAERIQMIFSLPYDQGWQAAFDLDRGR